MLILNQRLKTPSMTICCYCPQFIMRTCSLKKTNKSSKYGLAFNICLEIALNIILQEASGELGFELFGTGPEIVGSDAIVNPSNIRPLTGSLTQMA